MLVRGGIGLAWPLLRLGPAFEEGIYPLVQGVSSGIDRRLFEWIAFTVCEGLEPDFPLLSEGDGTS
jgi:hypothetical protein